MFRRLSKLVLLVTLLALEAIPNTAFIDSPLDWIFASHHTRGLVCPSLRYGCCTDLEAWLTGQPCTSPRATTNPNDCFHRKQWACCQGEADSFTCTTGFKKGMSDLKYDVVYGWRSGTSDNYFGIGKGALTDQEKQALGRTS